MKSEGPPKALLIWASSSLFVTNLSCEMPGENHLSDRFFVNGFSLAQAGPSSELIETKRVIITSEIIALLL